MVGETDGNGLESSARRGTVRHLLPPFIRAVALALFFPFFKSYRVLFFGGSAVGGLFLAIPINVVIWSCNDHLVLRERVKESPEPVAT